MLNLPNRKGCKLTSCFLILSFFTCLSLAESLPLQWSSNTHELHKADINGDGKLDWLLHSKRSELPSQYILSSDVEGTGNLDTEHHYSLPLHLDAKPWHRETAQVLLADFNNDEKADLYIVMPKRRMAYLFYANKEGAFQFTQPDVSFNKADLPWLDLESDYLYQAGDFDGNGFQDVLVASVDKDNHFFIFRHRQGFHPAQKIEGAGIWQLFDRDTFHIGDYNQDGRDDILILANKPNYPHFLFYAVSNGLLHYDKLDDAKIELQESDWSSESNSSYLSPLGEQNQLGLIKLHNLAGGYDEYEQYWPEAAPEHDGLGDTLPLEVPKEQAPEIEPCKNTYFIPTTGQTGSICDLQTVSSEEQEKREGKGGSKVFQPELADFTVQSHSTSGNNFLSPPTDYPATPGNSFKASNTSYQISTRRSPHLVFYELLESRTDSNYQVVESNLSGRFSRPGFSTPGYVYYRYRICDIVYGCSGLSPFRRLYIYQSPAAVNNLSAPRSATLGQSVTLTWQSPAHMIYHVQGYYETRVIKPNGGIQTLSERRSGRNMTHFSLSVSPNSSEGTYQYQVRACNDSQRCGPWSSVEVEAEMDRRVPITFPQLVYPNSNETFVQGQESNIRYQWRPVAGARNYDFIILSHYGNRIVHQSNNISPSRCQSGVCSISPGVSLPISNAYLWGVRAKSAHSTSSYQRRALNVISANRAPSLTGQAPTAAYTFQIYTFTPSASDPENDTLTFSITGKPRWASFNAASGRLTGTPRKSDVGMTGDIQISVTDGVSHVELPSFRINVREGNAIPQISGTPDTLVVEGESYRFIPTATDLNNDVLTFRILRKPSWAHFNSSNGALTGTPSYTDIGQYENIVISVSDPSRDRTELPAFNITVVAAPLATPVLTMTYLGTANDYKVMWGAIENASTYKLEVKENGNNWRLVEETRALFVTFTDPQPGEYIYRVSSCDRQGECSLPSAEQNIVIRPSTGQCSIP